MKFEEQLKQFKESLNFSKNFRVSELISLVTENVMESILEWQNRPLYPVYPIIFLEVIKVNQYKRVINKSIYLALAVNMEGKKELLGMWISENEDSKFWMKERVGIRY